MKKIIVLLITIPFFLVSCGTGKEESLKSVAKQIPVAVTESVQESSSSGAVASKSISKAPSLESVSGRDNSDKNNLKLQALMEQSPYKDLHASKQWTLASVPNGTNWQFSSSKGKNISISYKGASNLGSLTKLQVNTVSLTDETSCTEWKPKSGNFSEDDPIFVRADCKKYYHGFDFNGKKIEHDFKDSMDGIWISKTEPKIALYGGKLIVDFEKGDYQFSDKINPSDYMLLARLY